MKGSKVVGVRRGGPSLPPQLVSLRTSASFPFFSVWADGRSWGGSDRRPGKRGSPAPQDPQTLGEGVKGGQWGGGGRGFTPLFQGRHLAVPQFPQSAPRRTGRPEAEQTSRGSRRGGRIPYLGPPPLPALLRRGTDGSGLERREERGEQHLPQSPPRSAAPHGTEWNDTARHGTAWHCAAWNGTAWHCMVWGGWHGNAQCGVAHGGTA